MQRRRASGAAVPHTIASDRHRVSAARRSHDHREPYPAQIRCTRPKESRGLPRLSLETSRMRGGSKRWVAAARVTPPPESPERGRDNAGLNRFFCCTGRRGNWRGS
jgi:hypothetical protein